MPADRDRRVPAESGGRVSTTTRLKVLGEQAAARVYRAGTRTRAPRRSRLTGRAALLALVVCSLVVALAYPIRQWVSQQSEIADQRRQAREAREAVEKLRDEKLRWQDPAFVERQAREHLHYVRPGETGYTVVGGAGDGAEGARRGADSDAVGSPWYQTLWSDVDRADAGR